MLPSDLRVRCRWLRERPVFGTRSYFRESYPFMDRPSKKAIKAALDKLRLDPGQSDLPETSTPPLQAKKTNKNGIRKKGV